MGQGSRPERIADQIRAEVSSMIARDLRDPGIGFITITKVQVSPDLQHARVYYTSLGDPAAGHPTADAASGAPARRNTGRALERASPFMRRQIGLRLRLRRTPELEFVFDESIEHQDRVEQLLQELREERQGQPGGDAPTDDEE